MTRRRGEKPSAPADVRAAPRPHLRVVVGVTAVAGAVGWILSNPLGDRVILVVSSRWNWGVHLSDLPALPVACLGAALVRRSGGGRRTT